jgi:hypothetical protein
VPGIPGVYSLPTPLKKKKKKERKRKKQGRK